MPPDTPPRTYVRHFPRVPVDLRLVITDEHGERYRGRCSSVSMGGFGAVLAGELPMGAMVEVEFAARRSERSIRLMAHLRYRNGFHHGFEFTAPSDEQRQLIAEFFQDNLRSEEVES
jgi:hypothetical protein